MPKTDYSSLNDWLDEKIPEYIRQSKLPGFSIAVIEEGKTIYLEGFGARDPQKNLPATSDTLYGIGSVTKASLQLE